MTHCRLNGNHQSDPKAPCRGRLQIGTASGIKLECLSGFASEYPSGFIGIRTIARTASETVLQLEKAIVDFVPSTLSEAVHKAAWCAWAYREERCYLKDADDSDGILAAMDAIARALA